MPIDLSKYDSTTPEKSSKKKKFAVSEVLGKEITLFGGEFSDSKKEKFFSSLYILFSSGLDLKSALEVYEEQQKNVRDKAVYNRIKESLIKGTDFNETLKNSGKFSPYEFYSVRIGEQSGNLSIVLKELSDFFRKKIKQKRQFTNALAYPALISVTAVSAVWFMMTFIVPLFADVFARFGGDLPAITKAVLSVSSFISKYFIYLLLAMIIVVVIGIKERKKKWFQSFSSSLILKTPVIGDVVLKIYLARFCSSMSLLLSSRVSMLESLSLVEKMIGFYPIASAMPFVRQRIIQGASLNGSLKEYKVFNPAMLSLLKVGEEVNQLDTMFGKLAFQYGEEVEHKTSLLNTFLEPLLIIFLGVVVGIILVSMYLPIFKLSTEVF